MLRGAEAKETVEAYHVPAFVVSLDLVRHSTRSADEVTTIQRVLQTVLRNALGEFRPTDMIVNYTGDGYLCALINAAAAGGIDFLLGVASAVKRELAAFGQTFRLGADIGFIRLSRNTVTNRLEHFDQPGIRATRLQAACEPGEILVSPEVRTLFVPFVPDRFSTTAKAIKIKAHALEAFTLLQDAEVESSKMKMTLSELLFHPPDVHAPLAAKILVVDDDRAMNHVFNAVLRKVGCDVTMVDDGYDAQKTFEVGRFDLIITDLMMPRVNGFEVIDFIRSLDPAQPILAMTAAGMRAVERLQNVPCLLKPFDLQPFMFMLHSLLRAPGWRLLVSWFTDATKVAPCLAYTSDDLRSFFETHSGVGPVDGLLRHKAKEYVHAYLNSVRTGAEAASDTWTLQERIGRLKSLGNRIRRAETVGLVPYLNSVADDVRSDYPDLEILVKASEGIDSTVTDPGVNSALVLCATELVDNACDAVGKGGRVSAELHNRSSEGSVRLAVRNSGPKIPRRLVASIFEEGVTTKGSGRGLGLSLVKRLAESLGGNVMLDQTREVTFFVTFPNAAR